jgi:hypothetical protein
MFLFILRRCAICLGYVEPNVRDDRMIMITGKVV